VLLFTLVSHYAAPALERSVCEKLIDKRNEFALLSIEENAGSVIDKAIYDADCSGLVKLIPKALEASILRPYIWEGGNPFQLMFAFENTIFVLVLTFLFFGYYKFPGLDKLQIGLSLLVFSLGYYLIIGLTVPVMGAIVHYRVIASPFLLIAVLFFIDTEKLGKLSFYKRKPGD
jgi:hypothetical protein